MKKAKFKRVMALLTVVVLLVMYLMTFIFALIDNPHTMHLLAGSIGCTALFPVIMWAGLMLFDRKKDDGPDLMQ